MKIADFMRIFLCLVSLLVADSVAFAQDISATTPIVDSTTNQIVGYNTSEPSVYFVMPRQWASRSYASQPTAFVKDVGNGQFDVRFALAADYSAAAATIARIRAGDAEAMFFPLPRVNEALTLFLPEALGSIRAALTPDGTFTNMPVAYYRLRLSRGQLDTLVALAHGGLTLTGAAQITYKIGAATTGSTLPVTVQLRPEDLQPDRVAPQFGPEAWLQNLLDTYAIEHHGDLDGIYSLGDVIQATISQSVMTGRFLPKTYGISRGGNVFQCLPSKEPDFAGRVSFVIDELGMSVLLDFTATMALSLDASTMQVGLTRFDVGQVAVNGQVSSFYQQLIGDFMKRSEVRAKISGVLSRELQRRILAHTLFGVDEGEQ